MVWDKRKTTTIMRNKQINNKQINNKQINNSKNKAIIFFNFGTGCAMRLFISMYTLRKYYNGNALLMLQQNEEHTQAIKEKAKHIGIDVELMDIKRICKRNFKSIMAPKVLKLSPYETNIQVNLRNIFVQIQAMHCMKS